MISTRFFFHWVQNGINMVPMLFSLKKPEVTFDFSKNSSKPNQTGNYEQKKTYWFIEVCRNVISMRFFFHWVQNGINMVPMLFSLKKPEVTFDFSKNSSKPNQTGNYEQKKTYWFIEVGGNVISTRFFFHWVQNGINMVPMLFSLKKPEVTFDFSKNSSKPNQTGNYELKKTYWFIEVGGNVISTRFFFHWVQNGINMVPMLFSLKKPEVTFNFSKNSSKPNQTGNYELKKAYWFIEDGGNVISTRFFFHWVQNGINMVPMLFSLKKPEVTFDFSKNSSKPNQTGNYEQKKTYWFIEVCGNVISTRFFFHWVQNGINMVPMLFSLKKPEVTFNFTKNSSNPNQTGNYEQKKTYWFIEDCGNVISTRFFSIEFKMVLIWYPCCFPSKNLKWLSISPKIPQNQIKPATMNKKRLIDL